MASCNDRLEETLSSSTSSVRVRLNMSTSPVKEAEEEKKSRTKWLFYAIKLKSFAHRIIIQERRLD